MTYKSSLRRYYELIAALEQLPAIGKKSAQKMAYALAREDKFLGLSIAHAIENAALVVQSCQSCLGLSESELCEICADSARENGELCIVASARDIFTIEEMGEYEGRYFVLEGELEQIDFGLLNRRIEDERVSEIIFALSPSLANEAVMLYIEDRIKAPAPPHPPLRFSKIAQGVPTGIGLDSIDQLSLARAMSARVKL